MDRVDVTFREATEGDLQAIVAMLADDPLGRQRERLSDPLPTAYLEAFDAIAADPNNALWLACRDGEVVAALQLTFTPSISYQGGWRATIENVRTASSARGRGVGSALVRWAIERARRKGCRIVQLTTDKTRTDAKRFYERLGFAASHEGMKLHLTERAANVEA